MLYSRGGDGNLDGYDDNYGDSVREQLKQLIKESKEKRYLRKQKELEKVFAHSET